MLFHEGGERRIEAVRGYLFSLAAAAFLSALAAQLAPRGAARRGVTLACALLLTLTALRPLARIDPEDLALQLSRLDIETEEARTQVNLKNRALMEMIITEKTQAYILDKAVGLGLSIEAEVQTKDTGQGPYPYAVTLRGSPTAQQKLALQALIARNLAIPEERQAWQP